MHEFSPNASDLSLIELALQEDLGYPYFDATTSTLFSHQQHSVQANIISKHPTDLVICGMPLLPIIAAKFNCEISIQSIYQDGDSLASGAVLLTLCSTAANLLSLERTLLNFLRHLSAIATLTQNFVRSIKHTKCQVLDTRKTTPGLRHLEKYAIHCGGGVNHRQGLYDVLMIKDTHVDLLGGMELALAKLPRSKILPVIVEVRDLAELSIAIPYRHQFDRILLDNIRGPALKECVQLCKKYHIPTEASGNLTLHTVAAVAESEVDFVSVGMLTYSAGQVDLAMRIN